MFTKNRIKLWGLVLCATLSAIASAAPTVTKSPHNSYIVIMKLDPAISYKGGVVGYEATKPAKHKKFNAKTAHVKKYKNMLKKQHDTLLGTYGLQGNKIHDYSSAINGFSARMTHKQAKSMALNKKVARIIPDELHQKMTDNSPSFLNLDSRRGPWDKGLTGEDIIIGIIDTGIWPEHPSFADDGSYSDLGIILDESEYAACSFGNAAHRPDDAPFSCNDKLLGARQILPTYRAVIGFTADEFDSARDEDGHGTHTASTAGGNADVSSEILGNNMGHVTGIAYRARVIAYKALGDQGGFGSDLAAAIDQAVADGVDVINYSIGSDSFAIGPDDLAFLFAADAGVFVATSNGNSGPAPSTTGSPASVPWLTSVGASTQDRTYQGSVESSDGWTVTGISITGGTDELPLVDSVDAGSELCLPGELDGPTVAGKLVLCLRGAIARIDKSLAVSLAGGAGMILYNADDGQSQVTDTHHVPSMHINNTDGLVIKSYIATTVDPAALIIGGVYTEIDAPWTASFSSRGPNQLSGDIIKPDVTAPGVNILAGDTPVNRGQLFQMISGTSMSSPHVAGLFALLKQAHPDWTPAMAKSAMMTSAHQGVMKEDGETPADAFDMGAGHVEPGGNIRKRGSMFNPGLVYDVGYLEYLGFLCGAETGLLDSATCDSLASSGIPIDPSDLNLPSIAIDQLAGSQTVYRTVTLAPTNSMGKHKKATKYYVNVEAPAGYDVSVVPKKLKLKPGESASYAVTITNVSAPVNEWVHGSLAWSKHKSKHNRKHRHNKRDEIYSPIAVRGSLFAAPDSLTGVGENGSASFDISFGYAGSYSASAHGLEPAVVTVDAVAQDPDQAFDPGDGFSIPHTITVSGAALLRIAMPPEATDPNADLDLYLQNPQGDIVALSGNGGTDELLEVVNPEDGDWVLWVHGWAAPLDPTPYDLYSWVISATPGGSMSIDSAPASASLGITDTIDFSWTGATVGQWYYGLVSHSDGGGFIGLTKVEVDNR